MNPNVCYELWVTVMCHCRFIRFNKCTTLVGGIDNRGICGEKQVYVNSVFSAKLCSEPKTALKKRPSKELGFSQDLNESSSDSMGDSP